MKILLLDVRRMEVAKQLSQRLGLEITKTPLSVGDNYLVIAPDYLGLRAGSVVGSSDLVVDFVGGRVGHRFRQGEGKNRPLARAIGIKGQPRPRVLDLTAGLGRDAFVLASLGCDVTLVERSPYLAEVLSDGLARAEQDEDTMTVVQGMHLVHGEAMDYLNGLGEQELPDVIYMDPMYPHRDKSALVKKEMRIIRAFVGDDEDTEKVLAAALHKARRRVVVKRPRRSGPIGSTLVNFCVESKNTRYDVYLPLRV